MTVNLEPYYAVFQQLGYDQENEATLKLRIQLLLILKSELEKLECSQTEAAQLLGVRQPRVSDIYRLRIDVFSVEILVRYLNRLGKEVTFEVKNKA